jgi:CubicO group peptidase (beta-lactamase class C family)
MVWARDEKTQVVKSPNGEVAFYELTDEPLADWVARLLNVPLAHQPGKSWSYGYSYDVLGYLVEVISGTSLDRFFQERIFDPLEMTDTTFHLPAEKIERLSTMYCPKEGGGLTVLDSGPNSYWLPRKQFHSGGGDHGNALLSTVPDYYRFCQMLLNQGHLNGELILSRKTVELMTMDNMVEGVVVPDSPGLGAGLSFWVMQDPGKAHIFSSRGSFGGGGYAGTAYWVDPAEELVALIAIQNACWSWEAQNLFSSLVYQSIVD